MKFRLIQIGKWYLRIDIPLVVTELLIGFATMAGAYQVCKDTTFTDCKAFVFSELEIGFLVLNICIGKEQEITDEQLENIKQNG